MQAESNALINTGTSNGESKKNLDAINVKFEENDILINVSKVKRYPTSISSQKVNEQMRQKIEKIAAVNRLKKQTEHVIS